MGGGSVPADARAPGEAAVQRPRHLAVKLAAVLLVVAAVFVVHFAWGRYEGPDVRDQKTIAECEDADTTATIEELATTDDPCRARTLIRSFERHDALEGARQSVWLDIGLSVVVALLLAWGSSLELRSVRLRAAACVSIGLSALFLLFSLFVDLRLLLVLNAHPAGDLDVDWVARTAYAAHIRWPLLIGATVFAAFGIYEWARGRAVVRPSQQPRRAEAVATAAGIPFQPTPSDNRSLGRKVLDFACGRSYQPCVPPPPPPHSKAGTIGICCSGGGVRSAAFNLGALQALQEEGTYQDARYIAAVSGGSYTASAFAIVANQSHDHAVSIWHPPFERGSAEEQYLRNHSSYLAPGLVGKLALGWRMVRGFAVNLVIIGIVLIVVGLPIGWAIANGEHDSGIPAGSQVVLADRAEFANSLSGDATKIASYTARAGRGSRIHLGDDESEYALRRSAKVKLAGGAALDLVTGQHVVVAADHASEVDLPEFSTRAILVPTGKTRTVYLESGTVEAATGSTIRLASGVVHQITSDDIVELAAGSRLVLDHPAQIQVGEDARVDSDTGEVVDLCGSSRCVDHGVGSTIQIIAIALAALGIVLTMIPMLFRPNEKWTQIFEAWGARALIAAAVFVVFAIVLPEFVEWLHDWTGRPGFELTRFSFGGMVTVILAIALDFTGARGSTVSATSQVASKVRAAVAKGGPRVRSAIVSIVGAVIGPLALIAAFLAVVVWGSAHGVNLLQATIVASAVVAAALLETTCDLSRWSMHPFYKRRLRSAFALERDRRDGRTIAQPVDYDECIPLSGLRRGDDDGVKEPELIVCAAANLSNPGAAPPGRPVSTFTFSSTHIGGGWLGLLDPEALERAAGGEYERDVSLPAAVAMSGAALSPSMGKFTKRRYTFLLALANVRLGVWLPNPYRVRRGVHREADAREREESESQSSPMARATAPAEIARAAAKPWTFQAFARPHYLFKEMFGLTSYRDRFVYVTDGGHFENLGLVELLRRGCTHIYCFDASGGDVDSFAALGQAIAIARSELGVEIEIDPRSDGEASQESGVHHGSIRYHGEATATPLIFVRATVDDDAPWDVRAYRERDPHFPTHSTLDQLYTDEKFEAYRALGHHQASRAMEVMAVEMAQGL